MALQTRPLQSCFGVELVGVDVRKVDETLFAEIVEAFEEHSVLLFRGQQIGDEEQIAFTRRFGPWRRRSARSTRWPRSRPRSRTSPTSTPRTG